MSLLLLLSSLEDVCVCEETPGRIVTSWSKDDRPTSSSSFFLMHNRIARQDFVVVVVVDGVICVDLLRYAHR